jgi:NNP family nitrate/nitrite transporter-like MFS transporter
LSIGLFVGMAGGAFSVGTPYVARWFPKHQQGFAMGIYGAGNSGAAVNKFLAPALVVGFGWTMVPQVYAAIMLGTVILFWFFSHSDPGHLVPSHVTFRDQLKSLKDPKVIKYCQYYSIVFGGYVALSLWMVQYYVGEFGLDIRTAALLAACFSLPGGVLRAVGGWLSDKYGAHSMTWWVLWVSWICLFLLSYPQTDFTIASGHRPQNLSHWPERLCVHAADVHAGHCLGLWQGQRIQVHQRRLPTQHWHHQRHRRAGRRDGWVFACPSCLVRLMDLTGIRSSAFMLMYGVVWVSLIWMYWTEVRHNEYMAHSSPPELAPSTIFAFSNRKYL